MMTCIELQQPIDHTMIYEKDGGNDRYDRVLRSGTELKYLVYHDEANGRYEFYGGQCAIM